VITLTTDQQAPAYWTGKGGAELPLKWESGDPGVARVVPAEADPLRAMVVAVAPGETWVSVTDSAGVFLFADVKVEPAPDPVVLPDTDPAGILATLGARVSPDFGAYAAGEIDASQVHCVLCTNAPCTCPPFGSPEYLAMVDKLHGRPGV
jgi:hypothetical protein